MRKNRTRIVAQDQKTGEFAYLDQLIKDGFFPNLWVLPKNYDPPEPVGEAIFVPMIPIFNPSPQNVIQNITVNLGSLINIYNSTEKIIPSMFMTAGTVTITAV